MSVIWKYALPVLEREFSLKLPCGSEFMSCQVQSNIVVAWFAVEPENANAQVRFVALRTGEAIPEPQPDLFLASVPFDGSMYHLFMYALDAEK